MSNRLMIAALAAVVSAQAAVPRTMRVDLTHTGSAKGERFAVAGVVREGEWPGPMDRWVDRSNLGKYSFQIQDGAGRVIYSRGFASIFGEWETTDEAKQERSFSESLRFPEPAQAVKLVVRKRGPRNEFREIWSTEIDPHGRAVRTAALKNKAWAVMQNGAPADKVDLLLLGDGYTAAEMQKWHADARRMADLLFAASPFKEHRRDFNVWAIDTPAEQSGVARPSDGVVRHSPLGASYDAFGSERYILTMDNQALRDVAAAAPYEFIEIIVNDRKYGGGGIFNLYATVSADNAFTPYVFVHEFGHHFAGLADEYYTSDVSYAAATARPEPWEPNATADPKAAKWKDLLTPGIGLPSLWPKQQFEELEMAIQKRRKEIRAQHRPENEMEALFREEREKTTKLLASGVNGGKVGAFEGAMYEGRGYYRPQQDCTMFTRDEVGFCAVCRRAIEKIIGMYAR
ncbi:MAG TPA: M64 family metallopeptidase [Candidatus Sulfopaludibacter sp.]|nr:M64 family metallopeptidase [Candidatus Sulfopaludibacter sp.]